MSLAGTGGETDSPISTDRIGALDVLRGMALLGMFLVHFNDQAASSGDADLGIAGMYQQLVTLLFEERFWAMFGILFGVGFAVQLRRADARGRAFMPMYLRRLGALAFVGASTHAVLGYHVLLEYAIWGVPLLLVRRWSIRALVIAVVVSASSWSVYTVIQTHHGIAAIGESGYRSSLVADMAANRSVIQAIRVEQRATDFGTVVAANVRHMAWFYAQPYSFLPVNTLTLFLIGVIGVRIGVFDAPGAHRRLILALMAFGLASWALATWILPRASVEPLDSPLLRHITMSQIARGFGLIRPMWLVFTYMGGVLLLIAHDSVWEHRLAPFGWTGRMALTNYVVQIALLDLLFANFAIGVTLSPLQGLAAGLLLFAGCATASRWWLSRFRFGPLEWLWRSITYGRLQSLRMTRS